MSGDVSAHPAGVPAASSESWPWRVIRRLVMIEAGLAGAAIVAMMLIPCVDILMRTFLREGLPGAYDLVKIAGTLAVAFSLPYTTAVKGHVAIEFFFQKLGRKGRAVTDMVTRLFVLALFLVLAWQCVKYGRSLWAHSEVSPTLQVPLFWVPFVISACCLSVAGVKVYHITHPGREMIKP